MLAIPLMVFVLRQTTSERDWPGIEKYIKVAFWGTNVGLAYSRAASCAEHDRYVRWRTDERRERR